MAYTRTQWIDNEAPFIDAEHLNNIEEGIATLDTETAKKSDLENYAKKGDIPADTVTGEQLTKTLENYAKKDAVASKTDITDALEGYAKKTDIPSTDGLATKTDLDAYAKKTDIPSTEGLATKEELTQYAKSSDLEAISGELAGKVGNDTYQQEMAEKADKNAIPATLPTPNALTITLDGTAYSFDGSAAVSLTFDNAEAKSY